MQSFAHPDARRVRINRNFRSEAAVKCSSAQSPRTRARLLPRCRCGPLLIPVPTINRRAFSWPVSICRGMPDQSHRRARSLMGVESPDIVRPQTGGISNHQTCLVGLRTGPSNQPSWATATGVGYFFCLRACPPGQTVSHKTPGAKIYLVNLGVSDVCNMTNPSDVRFSKLGHGTPGRTGTARARTVGGLLVPTFPVELPLCSLVTMTKKSETHDDLS